MNVHIQFNMIFTHFDVLIAFWIHCQMSPMPILDGIINLSYQLWIYIFIDSGKKAPRSFDFMLKPFPLGNRLRHLYAWNQYPSFCVRHSSSNFLSMYFSSNFFINLFSSKFFSIKPFFPNVFIVFELNNSALKPTELKTEFQKIWPLMVWMIFSHFTLLKFE